MKKGFKLFLVLCFMFTFVFSLAFAGDGPPAPLGCSGDCCEIEANSNCNAGMGKELMGPDGICICIAHPDCQPAPECF